MKQRYWAVRPKSRGPEAARIEKAATAMEAADKAFGRGTCQPMPGVGALFEVKDLGSRVSVIQSLKQLHKLLNSPEGWTDLS